MKKPNLSSWVKLFVALLLLGGAGAAIWLWKNNSDMPAEQRYRTRPVERGTLVLAVCALAGCSDKNNAQAEAKKTSPSIPVLVAQAVEKPMALRLHAIGSVETVATVAVKARVDGQIFKAYVRDGQDVRKGDLLFQLDPKPYESQLAQVQANLAQSKAQLEYLSGQEKRYQELLAQNFVSREGYAQVASNFHATEASVNAAAAAVEARTRQPRLHHHPLADQRSRRQGVAQ